MPTHKMACPHCHRFVDIDLKNATDIGLTAPDPTLLVPATAEPEAVHLGPFESMEAAVAGGVPASVFAGHNEIVHATDVDVVGEAGTVVEVKHDEPPPRMVGPTFDLP